MKKQLMILYFLFAISLTCIAQSNQVLTFNGSSVEALEASMKEIAATMKEDEKNTFVDAFMFVVMGNFSNEKSDEKILNYFDGKTATELIEDVNKSLAEQAKVEYAELKKKISEKEKHKEVLNNIKISNYDFIKVEKFGDSVPAVRATIMNNTEIPLYIINFKISDATNPDNKTSTYEVFYRISENLNPGESITFTEALKKFKGNTEEFLNQKENFNIIASEIKDEKWKTIYDIDYFSEEDAARLEQLKNKYPELITE